MSAIAKEEAGADTAPNINDTLEAALPQSAWTHYQHLLDLMAQLGLDAAPDKCEGPTTLITWIGVVFDTIRLTMAIDPSKVEEARLVCLNLLSTSSIPVRRFHKFLDMLFHATKCTLGARTFFNWLLDALATENAGTISLGPDARADIHWFTCFLGQFKCHPHQALSRPARHSCGFVFAGRWRRLLWTGVLQDPLPGIPPSFWILHLQPRVLEPPGGHQALASRTNRH